MSEAYDDALAWWDEYENPGGLPMSDERECPDRCWEDLVLGVCVSCANPGSKEAR